MAAIKSNWYSVPNTCAPTGLTTFKNRLTTCLKKFCAKFQQQQQPQHTYQQQQQQQHYFKDEQQQKSDCGYSETAQSSVDRSFQQAIFSKKFKRFLLYTPTKKFKRWRHKLAPTISGRSQPKEEQRIEIVAKLLSSTLIASTTNSSGTTTTIRTDKEETFYSSNMTVTEELLVARYENPNLNAEVRSILIARAQNGATISEIKEDYKQLTGTPFPLLYDITEFLLTIPWVTATCTEQGTRIFNIMANDKTRHMYKMVTEQKPPQPIARRPYAPTRSIAAWRTNAYIGSHNSSAYYDEIYNNNKQWTKKALPQQQQEFEPPAEVEPMEIDERNSWENDNWRTEPNVCYQDNCNHLYSRLYSNNNNNNYLANTNNNINLANYNNNSLKDKTNVTPAPGASTQDVPQIVLNGSRIEQLEAPGFNAPTTDYNVNIMECNKAVKRKQVSYAPLWRQHGATVRSSSPTPTTTTRTSHCTESGYHSNDSHFNAQLFDFPLLGDDFFLFLARMELGCKFRKNQRLLQSGLCVSGQTIQGAIKRVRRLDTGVKRVIVNIGSVDIMRGRTLLQMQYDYLQLITVMFRKGLTPILTTLAPLANYAHDKDMKAKLQRFNDFIKRQMLAVIDIASCLVNERQQTRFDCYQNEPRNVTGATESYVFWNKIGRQRILRLIEANMEY